MPSYLVRPGDKIKVKSREASLKLVGSNLAVEGGPPVPEWLERLGDEPPEARVNRLPAAQDVGIPSNAQLIVELLSR